MSLPCRFARFVNSLIFLNQSGAYETWVLVAVFLSIALLVAGVVSLPRLDWTRCSTELIPPRWGHRSCSR